MNKVDLIFQKQPQEVQQKLMNLLIHYNAILQYNTDQDKFQVDLLLPFNDQSHKQTFLDQYHKNRKKNIDKFHQKDIQKAEFKVQENKYDKKSRKQSYENKVESIKEQRQVETEIKGQIVSTIDLEQQEKIAKQKIQEAKIIQENKINFNRIGNILASKINEAMVSIHKKKKIEKQKSIEFEIEQQQYKIDQNENQFPKIQVNEQQHQNQIKKQNHIMNLIKIKPQEEIYPQQQPYDQYQLWNQPSRGSSNQIRIQDDEIEHQGYVKPHSNYASLFHVNRIIQQKIQQDQQQLFPQQKMSNSSSDIRNITTQKHRQYLKQKYPIKKLQIKSSNNKLLKKYSDFFKLNHNNLQKIFQKIKKDLKRSQKLTNKSNNDSSILVLDQQDPQNQQQQIQFKQQVMKQYHDKIVVNYAMSSQDLVRYFRYLLKNARGLYIKYLRNNG